LANSVLQAQRLIDIHSRCHRCGRFLWLPVGSRISPHVTLPFNKFECVAIFQVVDGGWWEKFSLQKSISPMVVISKSQPRSKIEHSSASDHILWTKAQAVGMGLIMAIAANILQPPERRCDSLWVFRILPFLLKEIASLARRQNIQRP
jgi:hypothetical protein